MTPLAPDQLRLLVAKALATQPEELTCDDCADRVDRFAEMTLSGLDASQALPLVEAHLSACAVCRDEFEALMDVLRDAERDSMPWWRRWLSRS